MVRLSNLFGVGMATNNVISDIIDQIPGIGPLRVCDDTPVRDFLSVSEAVSALSQVLEGSFIGIINVGSGIGTSINSLAKLLLTSVGQQDREIIATEPSKRRSINVLDISETLKNIEWSPSSSLKDQIEQFVAIGQLTNGKT